MYLHYSVEIVGYRKPEWTAFDKKGQYMDQKRQKGRATMRVHYNLPDYKPGSYWRIYVVC